MNSTSGLTDDEVDILLTAAVTAPSLHNTQPWRFEVHGPVVDVLLDEKRSLPAEDPAGRAARIALGAAVFNIRVAAAMLGHESLVAPDPDPQYPEMAARVFLARREAPVPVLSGLYGELHRRHTHHGALLERAVSPKVLQKLDEAAQSEGARLQWLGQTELTQLGAIGQAVDETPSATGVLSTRDEHTAAWVQAGQALQRVLLVATSYDLTASFFNQVLERTASRFQVRELIGGRHWPQMVIRIGYPAQPNGRTPRRDWRDSFDQWF